MTAGRGLMIGMIAMVIGAVAAGFYVLGSPAEQRQLRLDERRLEDLQDIRANVDVYFRNHDRLPAALADIGRGVERHADPVSGERYAYRVVGERSYELCATFARAFTPEEPGLASRFWPHDAGRHCFTLDVESRR